MPCASRRKVPGCVPDVRIEVSRAAWSKHWRQCVWLTCPTPTRDTLASRCSKRTARKLPRCGTGSRTREKYIQLYCDLSSFGPALFEIWWPDIYLSGPYGPVKDKKYWPELARRSEKCAGPAGQCLGRGLLKLSWWIYWVLAPIFYYAYMGHSTRIVSNWDSWNVKTHLFHKVLVY